MSFYFLPPTSHAYVLPPLPEDHCRLFAVTCQNVNNNYVLMCCAWFFSCQSFCHCFLASSHLATLLGQRLCVLWAQNTQGAELEFPDAAVTIAVMVKILCFKSHIRLESKDCIANICRETHGHRGEMKYFLLWIFFMEGEFHYMHLLGSSFDGLGGIDLKELQLSKR